MPSAAEYRKRLASLVDTVPGSPAYSEISRTFTLVDPIFASEDLRRLRASRPFERFNEDYLRGQDRITQPAWQNLVAAWDETARELAMSGEKAGPRGWFGQGELKKAHKLLNASYVDGQAPGQSKYRTPEWDRKKYSVAFTADEWRSYGMDAKRGELEKTFEIRETAGGHELKFLDTPSLMARNGWKRDNFMDPRETSADAITDRVMRDVYSIHDPIRRATRILYLLPRAHPYENGNGRLARLWASLELKLAGHPIAVGLPTHDFALSEKEIELEIRKSLELGRLWEQMLKRAHADGVAPEEFFQKVFKGSPLEGLIHADVIGAGKLEEHVRWLKTIQEPPAWGSELAGRIEGATANLARASGGLANAPEMARNQMLAEVWEQFRAEKGVGPVRGGLTAPGSSCARAIAGALELASP